MEQRQVSFDAERSQRQFCGRLWDCLSGCVGDELQQGGIYPAYGREGVECDMEGQQEAHHFSECRGEESA